MKKRYWYVILTYILMHLSVIIGAPVLLFFGIGSGEELEKGMAIASSYWLIISFLVAFFMIIYILREDIKERHLSSGRSTKSEAFAWAFAGIFIALFSQIIAANIEIRLLGIEPGSDNTRQFVELVKLTPMLFIVVAILAPILEEVIFRKIIFGSLYKKFNFWISALISSFIFGVVHRELEHLLMYATMGLTFSFLYVKTKRIIVPIVAHVSMNSMVMLIQVVFADDIERIMKQAEQYQAFIGGL
ncbi:CPBP family intramembrane metalloprotease [Bacillus timonensis]|nr:CPBP family intramembrane metalloprotease [Bacillus timonensis]